MRHASLLLLVLLPSAAAQQTVTLGPFRDNTIYENPTGAVSNGAGTNMFVGQTGNGRVTRSIFRYDVASAIPQRARVLDVRFDAVVAFSANFAVGAADHSLHVVQADWGEGTTVAVGGAGGQGGGGAATTGSVTYLHTFFPNQFWQAPGGDFQSAPSATFPAPISGPVSSTSSTLTTDVQRWVDDPTMNFGWILKADDEARAARVYLTRESGFTMAVPRITVTYEDPIGTPVCGPAAVNAAGLSGEMSATGSAAAADNDVTITARNVTPFAFGFFIVARASGFVANPNGSFGNLCLSGPIGRYQVAVQNSGQAGTFSLPVDLNAIPQPNGTLSVIPGDTLHFQAWYRDSQMGAVGSNFTDALRIDFL